MALDDFPDIDDETLGSLGDLFDEPSADVVRGRPEPAKAKSAVAEDESAVAASPAVDDETLDTHFLDDAAIDEELLSSVEDVLSELDDLDSSEEEMFRLHSELGAPERKPRAKRDEPDLASAFPEIYPVEPKPDAERFASLLPGQGVAAPPRRAWWPTAAVLAANLALLLFAWSASRSLQAGLRDVRDELDEVRTGAPTASDARTAVGAESAPTASRNAPEAAPLPAFDQIALEIAERELERGLYPAARRRLHAVLALADRIDPDRRHDVEARMNYLIADSYRAEAELRREVTQ